MFKDRSLSAYENIVEIRHRNPESGCEISWNTAFTSVSYFGSFLCRCLRLLFEQLWHQNAMLGEPQVKMPWPRGHFFRTPPEPLPAPIEDPPSPLENPDAPVREPDPEDPAQI